VEPQFERFMTVNDCAYCHSMESVEVSAKPRTVRCKICGLYRLSPRMSHEGQLVWLDYHYGKFDLKEWGNPIERAARDSWEIERLKALSPAIFRDGTALDVGCASGTFVAALNAAGAKAGGLEPHGRLVELGRQHGLDLHRGRFEKGGIPSELLGRRFDLLTFRASLCYIFDIKEAFKLANEMLNAGGTVYIKDHVATSIYYKLNHGDYAKRYGTMVAGMPTKESLSYILHKEGYRVESAFTSPDVGFDFISVLFPKSFAKAAQWGLRRFVANGDLRLNRLLSRVANGLGMPDYWGFVATRAGQDSVEKLARMSQGKTLKLCV
jgi:SAM-dependent methyltransferase